MVYSESPLRRVFSYGIIMAYIPPSHVTGNRGIKIGGKVKEWGNVKKFFHRIKRGMEEAFE
ncbi:hypothetical protein LCGC14_0963750 [marine sediment metagenome]|uniref:Uncharacterized protein n=1 Tax=marine sediment metagenome TaxID=412755 RepID=A0A0F9NZT9_9ZZZZ